MMSVTCLVGDYRIDVSVSYKKEPDALDGVMCPKFSLEEIGNEKASCFSIAGIDWDALKPCWRDKDGEWLYLPDIHDDRGPERGGCKSISPSKL
ncbi:MAG: hypothetical protein KAY24_18745, partial [Candidatus Eisenbacteria sp.]|nr:hypothetical protein [Candidatus Eisenbacteria bacterium]